MLTVSEVTDNAALLCCVRYIYINGGLIFMVWCGCLGDIYEFLLNMKDHRLWLCLSEAMHFKCCFPLEPKAFHQTYGVGYIPSPCLLHHFVNLFV